MAGTAGITQVRTGRLSRSLPIRSLESRLPTVRKAVGEALIFWETRTGKPGPKMGEIDTDQIIPSMDCVSTDMADLSRPWGDGVFRKLRPTELTTVQQELARGKTFIVAGTKFGIGSSREMAVWGLLRAAKDAGQEGNLVVIAGSGMGNIFRTNAINNGLHIVESDQAVLDAQNGDRFKFDPNTRTLVNLTQGKTYREGKEIKPFTWRERIVYRMGGLVPTYRALGEFPNGRDRRPHVGRDASVLDGMTVARQILHRHRVFSREEVRSGREVHVRPDVSAASDGTAPASIMVFDQFTGRSESNGPVNPVLVQDHFAPDRHPSFAAQMEISTEFARRWGIPEPKFTPFGGGIIHFVLPHRGLVRPGSLVMVADSHATTHGAYAAYGFGVGSTPVGMAWALGYTALPVLEDEKITFRGRLPAWTTGKDIALALIAHPSRFETTPDGPVWVGAKGRAVEYHDPGQVIPIGFRHTISNMGAELDGIVSLFVHDAITDRFMASRGITPDQYPNGALKPGSRARYVQETEFDLGSAVPMVARPFHPNMSVPAEDIARERILIDQAALGSCTNGTYEDMLMAALVIHEAMKKGITSIADNQRSGSGKVKLVAFPGSKLVLDQMMNPEPLLGGQSVFNVLAEAGAKIRIPSCGHCFLNMAEDGLESGEVGVVAFNRNFARRNGKEGSSSYLASAYVVTASALAGYIATPSDLGLSWGVPFTEIAG